MAFKSPLRIAVCGAGIAGTTVSFLLAEQGHEVTLFEQSEECKPVGAGILLQPTGQAVLASLGLLEAVRSVSARIDRLHAVTASGSQLTYLPYADLEKDLHALGVHRGKLFSLLIDRCRAVGVHVVEGSEIVTRSIRQGSSYVQDTKESEHGPFDFVVAADGSRSNLRSGVTGKTWTHDYAHAALWAVTENSGVADELYQVVKGTDVLVGLLPTGNKECSFFWGLRESEWNRVRSDSIDSWKAEVLAVCPLAEASLESIESFHDATFATYRQVWMKHWWEEKLVFIGDAAHAMSPHLGQGVNFALMDAVSFCGAMSVSESFEEACKRFVDQRRSSVIFYWWLTRMLTPFFQSDSVILGIGRDLCLPLMPKIPWIKRQMLLSMSGMKEGWCKQLW